jgi:hypothetical protein
MPIADVDDAQPLTSLGFFAVVDRTVALLPHVWPLTETPSNKMQECDT